MPFYSPTGAGGIRIDQILTNLSVSFANNGEFVGNKLFPSIRVRKQTDKYYRFYGREGWLPEEDNRAPGTEANEIPGLQLAQEPYYASEHALQVAVTDEERENADAPINPDRDATDLITSKLLYGREKAIVDVARGSANYATGHVVDLAAGGTKWDAAGSKPIVDIKKARPVIHAKTFLEPNTLVIPYQVMTVLEDHTDFIERIKYSERAILTPDLIAAVLGFSSVLVPGLGITSGNVGNPVPAGYLWGKDVIVAYVSPSPGLKQLAFGYEFVHGYGGSEQVVDRWREEKRASDVIRVRRRYDIRPIGTDANYKLVTGYLIQNTVS
jgi:hypothetical protein